MNSELKRQIQENCPQCCCEEGESGVADKVANATQLCIDNQRQRFKHNWEKEIESFMKIMSQEYIERISYLAVPYDLLDWFEEYNGEMFGYIFEDMAMNLRLQKVSDQVEMLIEIIERANNILWEQRQIEKIQKEEEPKKKRIIRKKVCNGLRCNEHSYEPMDCWYDCSQCCERGHP